MESPECSRDLTSGSKSNKTIKRVTSKKELKKLKGIFCEEVPSVALNERILEKHFSKFGEVKKMSMNLEKGTATIYFSDHKSAKNAKEKGLLISKQISPIGAIYYLWKNRKKKSAKLKNNSLERRLKRKDISNYDYGVQDELDCIEPCTTGTEGGLFGMPPVPKLPTKEASFQSSIPPKASGGSSLFQSAHNVFGEKPSFPTTCAASNQGIFGRNKPFHTSASSFGTVASSSGPVGPGFKSQQLNIFAAKSAEIPSKDLFAIPSTKISNEAKTVTPDLFAGTGHKDSSSLFGGDKKSEPSDSTLGNIFATSSKPASSNLFAAPAKSENKLFGGGRPTSAGLFGTSDVSESSGKMQARPQQGTLFTRPDPPPNEKASNIFKISDSKMSGNLSAVTPLFGSKPSAKIGIKDRLGIKSALVRDPIEPISSGSNNPTSGSATPSECGSESSECTLDISPGGGSNKTFKRLTSKEELMTIKSIICEQVPGVALNERIMVKHFSKFGEIEKIHINSEKQSATIDFIDHKSAKKAKEKGLQISTKISPIGAIYYHRKNRNRKSSELKKSNLESIFKGRDTSNDDDDYDVQDELKSIEEYSSGMFQRSSFPNAAEKVDIQGGNRKRKGDIAQAPGLKKSALHHELPEIVQSVPTASTTITRPAFSKAELLIKMQAQAMDDLDRYNILEARDKYIKEISIQKSTQSSLKGTCPDICSEKERYSRSAKNQLRFYEKKDGVLHHKAVVKEYSRSAADASIPLSHELRPAHILKLTMDHLLCNIIDRVDHIPNCSSMEEWYHEVEKEGGSTDVTLLSSSPIGESTGDWFEFLWSATRGIRKDITQQVLTDLLAADLVEKCARFHIMCAERLVEEDNHNFDKKLNDENLTKCIQTLKHMYYDLGLEGTRCPNEPEFRAYEVLLNMNDGDTLRRVQNLEPWIRESSEITFALKVLATISNNNYVRFFKLVRTSTLLQGCILLRYFNQVRRKALQTMIRAYCSSKSVTMYSLSKVMMILGFEDISSCARYCRHHGLESEIESDTLYMDRSTFHYPDETLSMQRPINLVESKRNVKWSAVVNGGPLPVCNPYISYEPHNSFDDDGYLKKEAFEAKDQTLPEDSNKSFEELKARQERIKKQEEVAQEIKNNIISEVSRDMIHNVSTSTIKELQIINASKQIIDEIEKDISEELCNKVATEAIREEKNLELQRRIRKEEIMNTADDVSSTITEEVVAELIDIVAAEEIEVNEKNLLIEKQIGLAPDIWETICNEVIAAELSIIVNTATKEAKAYRDSLVEKMRENNLMALQRKSFDAWRHYVAKLQKQKNALNNFPSTPSFKSIAEQADLLSWGNQNDEKPHSPKSLKDKLKNKQILSNLLNAVDLEEEFLNSLVLKKIDLFENVGKCLVKSNPHESKLTWKLIICIPNTNFESRNRAICEMVKRKFSADNNNDSEDPNLLLCQDRVYDNPEHSESPIKTKRILSLCVRCVPHQVLAEEISHSEKQRRDKLLGTSSILFLHIENDEMQPNEETPEDDDDNPTERLHLLLQNMPRNPPVPLHVMTTSRSDLTEVVKKLQLEFWVEQKAIKSYHVTRISINIFNLESLINIDKSVIWLAENSFPSNYHISSSKSENGEESKLVVKPLLHFVQDLIFNQVFTEFYDNLEARLAKGYTHQHPNILINLYNGAIQHIIELIKNPQLHEISWPIPELKRNSLDYGSGEAIPVYWNDAAYTDKVCENLKGILLPHINDEAVTASSMTDQRKCIDGYIAQLFRTHSESNLLNSEIKAILERLISADMLPWTDFILAVIKYRFSCMNIIDPFCTKGTEMIIGVYNYEFRFPHTWTSNLYSSTQTRKQKDNISNSLKKSLFSDVHKNLRRNSLSDLEKTLNEEKYKSDEFERILKSAIKGNSETNTSLRNLRNTNEAFTRQGAISAIVTENCQAMQASPKYYHVPVSYLSPAVNLLSEHSPNGPKQRVELLGSYDRKIMSPNIPIKGCKRKSFDPQDISSFKMPDKNMSYSHSKSGIVRSLKQSVDKDIEDSEAFDKKLQEALIVD